jgi:hypothetical protein
MRAEADNEKGLLISCKLSSLRTHSRADQQVRKAEINRRRARTVGPLFPTERHLTRSTIMKYDPQRVSQIVDQLLAMFMNTSNPFNTRTGGLIGLAGVAIGIADTVGPYLDRIVLPVVECCKDPDGRIRYHGCESLYNM